MFNTVGILFDRLFLTAWFSQIKGRNRWQQRKENNNGSNSGSSSPRQTSNQWNNKMANLSLDDNVNSYQNRSPNQAPRFHNQNQGNQGYRPNNYQKAVPFPSPNVFESMGNYQGGYNNGYQNGYNNQNGYGQRPYTSKYFIFLFSVHGFWT